jgi:hypothetical protein
MYVCVCMCVCIHGRRVSLYRCSPGVHPGNNFILTRQPVTSWNDDVQMDSMDRDESKVILGASTKLPAYKAEIRFISLRSKKVSRGQKFTKLKTQSSTEFNTESRFKIYKINLNEAKSTKSWNSTGNWFRKLRKH